MFRILKRLGFVLTFTVILLFGATAALAAGGTGPGDALSPDGQLVTVAPHSAEWFVFNVGGGRHSVNATVDANGASGIRLAIYTPEQISNWLRGDDLKAVGNGAPGHNHDLEWDGDFNIAGTYYAAVYNDSDAPVPVQVSVTGDAVTTAANTNKTTSAALNGAGTNPIIPTTPVGKGISGKLAFVDAPGGNLYTVNGDGTNLQRVSFGLDPQWNHAGTQIALARQGPVPGIFIINADGSNEHSPYGSNEVRAPDWSPDDSQIVFSKQNNTSGGGERCFTFRGKEHCFSQPEDVQWTLGLLNLVDNTFKDLKATNHASTPTWNSDGVTIAFNDLTIAIMQMNINNAYQPFAFIGDLRITETDYNPLRLRSPQYSPDGKKIVYMVEQQPTWQIAVANADGSDQHLLTTDDVLADTHPNNVAPVWSPDGKQILFLSNRNGKWEFFTMNADGSNVQQVLKNITDQITINYTYNSDRIMSWAK